MGPWWGSVCLLWVVVVAALVAGSPALGLPTARGEATRDVPTATPPCPFITASSPQTLSTAPPPGIQCPGVVLGRYFGGGSADWALDVAFDPEGNAYVVGYTNSTDFPTTLDAFDGSLTGDYDVFLAKFAPTGILLHSTLLGGSLQDAGLAVALDSAGNVYVAGSTNSSDFPTTPGALDTTHNGEGMDGFLAKFDPLGGLVYATFLGGSDSD
ncbi:MAG: SBBP repeat-containing protein, partial [Methanobacteriota archaeon]